MKSILAVVVLVAGCGSATVAVTTDAACADVEDVAVTPQDGRRFRFDVTVRSPDTGLEKYADRWEVRDTSGAVLGTRVLTHPHVDEQPFTRSEVVDIPEGISEVVVAARDSVEGFCGEEMRVDVD